MQEDAKPQESLDQREAKLVEHLAAFNEKPSLKPKKRDEDLWTIREGVYMVIFQAVVILLIGGIHGSQLRPASVSAGRGSMLINADGEATFDMSRLFDGAGDMFAGYPHHFQAAWWADIGLLISMILVVFLVKQTRVRRRCFMMMVVITMAVIGGFLVSDIEALRQLTRH